MNGNFDPSNPAQPSGAYQGWPIQYWSSVDAITGVLGGWNPSGRCCSWGQPASINIRHGTGTNFLACDGHVKYLAPEKVSDGWTPTSPGNPQGWNTWGAATTDNMQIATWTATLTFSTM